MLPDAISSFVLGVLSLAIASGALCGYSRDFKTEKDLKIALQQPGFYQGGQFDKTGKLTSTMGLVIGILSLIFWILYFTFIFNCI